LLGSDNDVEQVSDYKSIEVFRSLKEISSLHVKNVSEVGLNNHADLRSNLSGSVIYDEFNDNASNHTASF
jgi:hypothetical protein